MLPLRFELSRFSLTGGWTLVKRSLDAECEANLYTSHTLPTFLSTQVEIELHVRVTAFAEKKEEEKNGS